MTLISKIKIPKQFKISVLMLECTAVQLEALIVILMVCLRLSLELIISTIIMFFWLMMI